MSDSVGFGFVVRGEGPCYVQTVDPSGPAASAGLKVCLLCYCMPISANPLVKEGPFYLYVSVTDSCFVPESLLCN